MNFCGTLSAKHISQRLLVGLAKIHNRVNTKLLTLAQEVIQSMRVHPWDPLEKLCGHEALEVLIVFLVSTLIVLVA